ncbi:hypothetical protein AB0G04_44130 [Actinoplanes sp. NPDC023801]|uniref:hypothetical protein n=1 Tax=Actinoplanes sp. NPDC023801 TaxID=3154595 RepID=UPI0033C14728
MRRIITMLLATVTAFAGVIIAPVPAHALTIQQYIGYGRSYTLRQGYDIESVNGRYRLRMQLDGNMVLYDYAYSPARVCGVSRTTGLGAIEGRLQTDNNFVLYAANSGVWASTSTHLPRLAYRRLYVTNGGAARVVVSTSGTAKAFAESQYYDTFWQC